MMAVWSLNDLWWDCKLIEYGCPVDFKNKKGETALSIVQAQQPYERELIAVLSGEGR